MANRLVLATWLWFCVAAWSALPEWQVQPLAGGVVVPGRLAAVRVTLTNRLPFRGELACWLTDSPGLRTVVPLALGPGTFTYELALPVPTAMQNYEAKVLLRGAGSSTVREHEVKLLAARFGYEREMVHSVGLVGSAPDGPWAQLPELMVSGIPLEGLPATPELLGMHDRLLITHRGGDRLTAAHAQMLEAWVRAGGRLTIAGDAVSRFADDHPFLRHFGIVMGEPGDAAPGQQPWRTIRCGDLVADGANPWRERRLGLGSLVLCSWRLRDWSNEPVAPPEKATPEPKPESKPEPKPKPPAAGDDIILFDDADDASALTPPRPPRATDPRERLLVQLQDQLKAGLVGRNQMSPDNDYERQMMYSNYGGYARVPNWGAPLREATGLQPIPVAAVLGLLAVFALIVTVGERLVLGRLKKLHWTWVTTTLLVAVFCVGAAMISRAVRGFASRQVTVVIDDVGVDGGGWRSALTCFIPARARAHGFQTTPGMVLLGEGLGQRPDAEFLPTESRMAIAGPVWGSLFVCQGQALASPPLLTGPVPRPTDDPPRELGELPAGVPLPVAGAIVWDAQTTTPISVRGRQLLVGQSSTALPSPQEYLTDAARPHRLGFGLTGTGGVNAFPLGVPRGPLGTLTEPLLVLVWPEGPIPACDATPLERTAYHVVRQRIEVKHE